MKDKENPLWKLIKETSTKIVVRRPVEAALIPCLSILITDSKRGTTSSPKQEMQLLYYSSRFSFYPVISLTNRNTTQLSQWKAAITWTYFLQWTFIFLLLMTSLTYTPFYKSFLPCITPRSISLLASWHAAWLMNQLVKPIRSLNSLS